MGGGGGEGARGVAERLAAALAEADSLSGADGGLEAAGPKPRSRRSRLEGLAAARLRFFDEARAAGVKEPAELAATGGDSPEPTAFLAVGAAALAPIVAEAFAEARAAGRDPLLPEAEAALALWAMLEAVLLGAARRGDTAALSGKARSAGLALEVMLAELCGLDEGTTGG